MNGPVLAGEATAAAAVRGTPLFSVADTETQNELYRKW